MPSSAELKRFIGRQSRSIDLELMSRNLRKQYDTLTDTQKAEFLGFGANGSRENFDTPYFLPLPEEEVYSNGNAFIVLGLDRNGPPGSGFGGQKNTHCAAIDIVAGREGGYAMAETFEGELNVVSPNFHIDAARVYISQKADPDNYFGLVPGTVGNTSAEAPRSTVGLKADTLRFVARENIKLITRVDPINSQRGILDNKITKPYGINLIAMNDDSDLQPLVKGANLVECLDLMASSIGIVMELFNNFVQHDRAVKRSMNVHAHATMYYGSETAPDFDGLMPSCTENLINVLTDVDSQFMAARQALMAIRTEYLATIAGCEAIDPTDKLRRGVNILSSYNFAN